MTSGLDLIFLLRAPLTPWFPQILGSSFGARSAVAFAADLRAILRAYWCSPFALTWPVI